MAWNNSKKNKKKETIIKKIGKKIFGKNFFLVMILLALLGVATWLLYLQVPPVKDFIDGLFPEEQVYQPQYIDPNGNEMAVHYIDVGQADATLLQTTVGSVLIDCGESASAILNYLDLMQIKELEYLILTHAHDDHMGCAAEVLQNIKVKNVILSPLTSTVGYYEDTVAELEKQKDSINVIEAIPGEIYTVGALQMRILGPYDESYKGDDPNNSSVIVHATYGNRAFLFTGDAEKRAEGVLVDKHGKEIKCDVFSAGHHGAETSNTDKLLQAAAPSYVVISVGAKNNYGHPTEEALNNFNEVGATVYRTDKNGTVVFVTDGETLIKK